MGAESKASLYGEVIRIYTRSLSYNYYAEGVWNSGSRENDKGITGYCCTTNGQWLTVLESLELLTGKIKRRS